MRENDLEHGLKISAAVCNQCQIVHAHGAATEGAVNCSTVARAGELMQEVIDICGVKER